MEELIGTIKLFAGNFAPEGWEFCEGQELRISEYQVLHSIIGNTYGGNGTTTFCLPDLRGKVPVGQSADLNLGEHTGNKTIVIQNKNLPPITGSVNVSDSVAHGTVTGTINMDIEIPCDTTRAGNHSNNPSNSYISVNNAADRFGNAEHIFSDTQNGKMAKFKASSQVNLPVSISPLTFNFNTQMGGNSTPVDIMQPSLGLNYIICIWGIMPNKKDRRILINEVYECEEINYKSLIEIHQIGNSNTKKKIVEINVPLDLEKYAIGNVNVTFFSYQGYDDVFASTIIGVINSKKFKLAICRIDGDGWSQDLEVQINYLFFEKK